MNFRSLTVSAPLVRTWTIPCAFSSSQNVGGFFFAAIAHCRVAGSFFTKLILVENFGIHVTLLFDLINHEYRYFFVEFGLALSVFLQP